MASFHAVFHIRTPNIQMINKFAGRLNDQRRVQRTEMRVGTWEASARFGCDRISIFAPSCSWIKARLNRNMHLLVICLNFKQIAAENCIVAILVGNQS